MNSVAAGTSSDADSPSRRQFLKVSAAAAGSSLLGGCLDGDPVPTTFRLGGAAFDTFDHTIVVMFENRSLDSLLGFVYTPATVPRNQTYNGLADGEHRCPVPPYIDDGRKPTFDEYRVIMDSFGDQSLPVISTLARSFAVFDAWFCSVPSQTLTNRSFFHASTASG